MRVHDDAGGQDNCVLPGLKSAGEYPTSISSFSASFISSKLEIIGSFQIGVDVDQQLVLFTGQHDVVFPIRDLLDGTVPRTAFSASEQIGNLRRVICWFP